MLLSSVSFIFNQCLVLNKGTRIALYVQDVGELGICIMGGSVLYFVPEIAGNVPSTLLTGLQQFSLFVFPLEVLVMMIPRSRY